MVPRDRRNTVDPRVTVVDSTRLVVPMRARDRMTWSGTGASIVVAGSIAIEGVAAGSGNTTTGSATRAATALSYS
jgi:hypothetical protein